MGLKGKSKKKRTPKGRPSGNRRKKFVLDIVRTDNTYELVEARWGECWQGKCLFCNRKLTASLTGGTNATIEHIRPLNHGGTEDLTNLALACGSCNGEKGRNHDCKSQEPTEIIEALLAVRQARWRDS